jgi:Protein involved in chromosome segregation, interacts with SMC proteins
VEEEDGLTQEEKEARKKRRKREREKQRKERRRQEAYDHPLNALRREMRKDVGSSSTAKGEKEEKEAEREKQKLRELKKEEKGAKAYDEMLQTQGAEERDDAGEQKSLMKAIAAGGLVAGARGEVAGGGARRRRRKLPERMAAWGVEDVGGFVRRLGAGLGHYCEGYSRLFEQFRVGGKELPSLTRDDLTVGPGGGCRGWGAARKGGVWCAPGWRLGWAFPSAP